MSDLKGKANKGLSWLDELTPQRIITLVVILAILAVGIYFLVRYIKKGLVKLKMEDQITDHILQTGEKASFNDAEYLEMAQELAAAFDGPGTDEAKVFSVFQKLQNKTDVLKLINAYGYRIEGRKLFGKELNLADSLKSELTAAELSKVNNILSSKNINYAF